MPTLSIGKIHEFSQLRTVRNNERSKHAEATNQRIDFDVEKLNSCSLFWCASTLLALRSSFLPGCMGGTVAQIRADAEPPGSLRPRDEGTMSNCCASWSLEGKLWDHRGYLKSPRDGELPGATRESCNFTSQKCGIDITKLSNFLMVSKFYFGSNQIRLIVLCWRSLLK